jgi:hypothetical protein
MTTTVTIKHEGPDHHDVLVTVVDLPTKAIRQEIRLKAGDTITNYIHTGQGLTVSEVSKLPA